MMSNQMVDTNGIRLNVVQAGQEGAPLVILLHGFPDFSYSWRKLMPLLVSAGYRVWAPDQRGYNLSDKPEGIAAYTLDELAKDVVGLIDAAGEKQAFLVGHDWGAGVAWWVAGKYPQRLSKLVVMNVPHGSIMQKFIRTNFRQLLKSWYIFFFQLPWLPEKLASMGNWASLSKKLAVSSRRGTFTEEDLDQYRTAWSRPGAYNSMLNWYRAFIQLPPERPTNSRISVPTLLIWGARDRFLSIDMAQPSIDKCDHGRLAIIEEASHWVHHEETGRVNDLITEFLQDE